MVPAALNRHQSVRLWLWFCLLRIRNCHHIMQQTENLCPLQLRALHK